MHPNFYNNVILYKYTFFPFSSFAQAASEKVFSSSTNRNFSEDEIREVINKEKVLNNLIRQEVAKVVKSWKHPFI